MTHQAIVVVVQDSETAPPALDWAGRQASISSAPVYLTHPYARIAEPLRYWHPVTQENHRRDHVASRVVSLALAELGHRFPSVHMDGSPMAAPLDAAVADLSAVAELVVLATDGAAAEGAVYRMAARARCPVILAPPGPAEPDPAHRPVVLLVENAGPDLPAMEFACAQASEWDVGLVALGLSAPGSPVGGPRTPEPAWRRVEDQLSSLRQAHSDLQVSFERPDESPLASLAQAARSAQLIVVPGRDDAGNPMLDHGALVDAALRQGCCVAVVPAGTTVGTAALGAEPARPARTARPAASRSVAAPGTLAPT